MKLKPFKNRCMRQTSSIAIIGSADGPTAVYSDENDAQQHEQQAFLELAAEKIKPCERAFSELPAYLADRYAAIPYTLSEREAETLKINVILNHFRDQIEWPEELPVHPTHRQLMDWHSADTSVEQARQLASEDLGLQILAFKLPDRYAAEAANETVSRRFRKHSKTIQIQRLDEVRIELETTTGYMALHNGRDEVMNDIVLWMGVSEQDIYERSPRFISYAYTCRQLGKL
ncbi:hypothetical protein [Candidatus Soleaferrea massiliensis]|uniref:hypothetical protein n=1 Tax=Candidatus Soleaferrea massiliensis TaxID=1470354 RepID=UPI00058E911F|nr:hypothetical protein [Candidatus Soleaferrea massiliensis]